MTNVMSFREARRRQPTSVRPPESPDEEVEQAFRIAGLQADAREEIFRSILMLDLAAQHARQISERVCDPTMKRNFTAHISIIEQLLQLARGMALKL
jgi:hypothetical protein